MSQKILLEYYYDSSNDNHVELLREVKAGLVEKDLRCQLIPLDIEKHPHFQKKCGDGNLPCVLQRFPGAPRMLVKALLTSAQLFEALEKGSRN
jgi:hypothetical protein